MKIFGLGFFFVVSAPRIAGCVVVVDVVNIFVVIVGVAVVVVENIFVGIVVAVFFIEAILIGLETH